MKNSNKLNIMDKTKTTLKTLKYMRFTDDRLAAILYSFKVEYDITDEDWIEISLLMNVVQLKELHKKGNIKA